VKPFWRYFRPIAGLMLRAAWWCALWLLLVHGHHLVDLHVAFEAQRTLRGFVLGFVLVLPMVMLGDTPIHRRAGFGLGALHGTAALVLWLLLAA